jgi:hypothetical protein
MANSDISKYKKMSMHLFNNLDLKVLRPAL